MSVSWYKLKTGDWGIKIKGEGAAGQQHDVTNAKGETTTVTLKERAAKFDDAQLWSIENVSKDSQVKEVEEAF